VAEIDKQRLDVCTGARSHDLHEVRHLLQILQADALGDCLALVVGELLRAVAVKVVGELHGEGRHCILQIVR
jgi:hypothetical protein